MSCPDDNVLVAMVEQALEPALFAQLEVHIDTCEHCRKILAAAVADSTLAVGTPQAPVDGRDEIEPLAQIIDVSINGRYVIDAVLGRGGMGTVYLARDLTLGREVALKLHRAGSGNDRLHREAVSMAKLAHPNVVTVFEIATVDDRLYVAMEYVRGETLRGWLTAAPRSWRDIIDLLLEVGRGLAAAHAAGLVHRDFKPENVLVGEDGRPRVGDFGLARVGASDGGGVKASGVKALGSGSSPDANMTETGTLLGTPAYMAPEQLNGEVVDARCDQFAFCVVAWECLFGKRPFGGPTLAALEESIKRQQPQRAKTDVPQRVCNVLERGLLVEPSARHADLPALLAALKAAASPRTKRWVAVGVAGALLAGGATIATVSVVGARREEAACAAAGDEMRKSFGEPKRTQMRGAFVATGSIVAASAFDRTASVLERYAGVLAQQATAACHRADEPAWMVTARRACLDERRSELTALTEILAHPDAALVSRAPNAAWAIFEPAPCDDPALLIARPAVAKAWSPEQTAKVSRVKAFEDAGQYQEGIALATQLLDEARAQKNRTLELAVLLSLGSLRSEVDDPQVVTPLYHQAVALAETLGRDQDAAGAHSALAHLAGVMQQDYEAAHRSIALARAKLERLGGKNLAIRGVLLTTEAQVLLDENRLGEAERAMREAVTTLEQAFGADHPKVGAALGTLSQILRPQPGKAAEALAVSTRTLDIMRRALGDDHPLVAGSEMNLAQSLIQLERFGDARERLDSADAVFSRVYGDDHPVRAAIAGNLSRLEQTRENWEAALTASRRAVAILERVEGPDSANVSGALRDVAINLAYAGRFDEAIVEQQRAIAIVEQLGADGEPRLVSAFTELAEMELAREKPVFAVVAGERALAIAQRRPADSNPDELNEARFVLARALWDANRDRPRALKLAEEAKAFAPEKRSRVETWIRERQR